MRYSLLNAKSLLQSDLARSADVILSYMVKPGKQVLAHQQCRFSAMLLVDPLDLLLPPVHLPISVGYALHTMLPTGTRMNYSLARHNYFLLPLMMAGPGGKRSPWES
eukprot:CAMPEP_0113641146 /NCGR_PEP_ID=MMETSP0017_2-20120614/21598_1 /TAXON_ID=2856 /ORGANISM="Cylindrotheca closterium" /LENGTH=106 /DNA_ID=CAMNT_0000552469 /DNA_START=1097 /DNA_END=1417 /DNA_ORIENTATION=+ /assembly_acc=CAM_ASM_000147